MVQDTPIEICQYCFGAKELTKNGKLFSPCPVCKGGKIEGEKLVLANKKWLKEVEQTNNLNDEQ